jgi:hypothetical protein
VRFYEIKVYYFDPLLQILVEVPCRSVAMSRRPDAGTTMAIEPREPFEGSPLGLAWQCYVRIGTAPGTGVKKWIFKGGISREATTSREVGQRAMRITCHDRLATFSDQAPLERVHHKDTNLEDELQYLVETVGFSHLEYGMPEILIPRIDYVPPSSYWDSLSPYLGPFEPLVFGDASGDDSALTIFPTLIGLNSSNIATFEVELSDIQDYSFDYNQYEIENQTKLIIHRKRGEKNTGTATGVQERRVPRSANGDGSSSENWERYVEVDESGGLGEDEPGVSVEKHEVIVGHGYMHWSSQGLPIRKDVSETEYEENYTLPVRQTRTISGRVNLPIVGQVYREEAFEEVTDTTWIPWDADDDHPYTWTMTKQRTERSGYYLVNEKVPIDVATANNSVDTTTDSSQTYARGLHTVIETVYQAIAGDSMVMQKTTTYNTLYTPARVIGDPEVSFVGRNTITLSARPKTWRITGNVEDFAPRREQTFDGTLFGYDLSVRIINARHARAGYGFFNGTIKLKTPNLEEPALGQILRIVDLTDPILPAHSLIVGIDFQASALSNDGRQEFSVGQKLLVRSLP